MSVNFLNEVLLLQPTIFYDDRGYFYESFNKKEFLRKSGIDTEFVQDNYSRSKKNVLRGLHYQLAPCAQGKLVSIIKGEIFDVVVDIRKDSLTFGQWKSYILSESNQHQLWIPPGFAHGYYVLSEVADVFYKTTAYYCPELSCSIIWNDPQIGIEWPITTEPVISSNDTSGLYLKDAKIF